MVSHLKRITLHCGEMNAKKIRKEGENPVRKLFQKFRLVTMVALPWSVEVEVIITSQILGTLGR